MAIGYVKKVSGKSKSYPFPFRKRTRRGKAIKRHGKPRIGTRRVK